MYYIGLFWLRQEDCLEFRRLDSVVCSRKTNLTKRHLIYQGCGCKMTIYGTISEHEKNVS